MGSSSPHSQTPVIAITTKSCYQYLLSENIATPHCVDKFRPTFGVLYWSTTWTELFLLDIDCQVIDLPWKIAHGVLYTAARLASFGYDFNTSCFFGPVSETLEHLFFYCPLAFSVLSWLQSLMFISSPLASSLVCRHALFGFNSDELLVVPRIFVYILNVCKFFIWHARNDLCFRDIRPGAASVIENVKTRVRFHLPLYFKRFVSSRKRRYFHRQWGGRGAVASVVGDRLVLHLKPHLLLFVCLNLGSCSLSVQSGQFLHAPNLDIKLLCSCPVLFCDLFCRVIPVVLYLVWNF